MTDEFYVEVSGVGVITQLNDRPRTIVRAFPFGFTTPPQEDPMTPYRDRHLAGAYDPKKAASWTDEQKAAKKTTKRTARKTTKS